jgi:hypothetical protein
MSVKFVIEMSCMGIEKQVIVVFLLSSSYKKKFSVLAIGWFYTLLQWLIGSRLSVIRSINKPLA